MRHLWQLVAKVPRLRFRENATNVETEQRDSGPPGPRYIAIDGPSASGKSAVGGRVAERLGYRFIDTGMMYRAITWLAHERQVDLEDDAALTRLAENVELTLDSNQVRVEGHDVTNLLRTTEVGKAVSLVSRVAGVREAMVRGQRAMAGQGRVVMAGRDIGTVVLPDASLKVYLEASAAERDRRRHEELRAMGRSVTLQQVRDELAHRDTIDSKRAVSPLRPAEDAVVIDTDALSLEQVVERILELALCQS